MPTEVTIQPTCQIHPLSESHYSLPQWYVLHTRSHCEKLVYDQLVAKGFHLFLPTIEVWSRRSGLQRVVRTPLFSGYLFLHHFMEKCSYIEVCKTRGLVSILRNSSSQLAVVPETEIASIHTVIQERLPVLAHPFLHTGQKVRITRGALAGVEGFLLRTNVEKGILVLSITLLQRSLAVEIDCTAVEAA